MGIVLDKNFNEEISGNISMGIVAGECVGSLGINTLGK